MFPQSEAELLPLNDKSVPCNDNGSCCRLLALALACCGLALLAAHSLRASVVAAMPDVAVNSSDELGTSSCYNKRVPHDVFCVGCKKQPLRLNTSSSGPSLLVGGAPSASMIWHASARRTAAACSAASGA